MSPKRLVGTDPVQSPGSKRVPPGEIAASTSGIRTRVQNPNPVTAANPAIAVSETPR